MAVFPVVEFSFILEDGALLIEFGVFSVGGGAVESVFAESILGDVGAPVSVVETAFPGGELPEFREHALFVIPDATETAAEHNIQKNV